MTDDDRIAYLALMLVPGMGRVRLHALLQAFHTPSGAHSAPLEFLCRVPGISSACASAIKAVPLEEGRRVAEQVEQLGGQILMADDPRFPRLLHNVDEPPPILFAQGDLGLLEQPAVAVVGSRDHSAYGGVVARSIAGQAAQAGLVVVSGMARGLDAVAHAAALDAGGTTIGVLGNGLGVIYPTANRRLYERVAERGLLLTEFPPGERPNAGSFPRRNRLISGLARVTVVVEAAVGSGALITARSALEQGREVVAVPGPITSSVSVGCNQLVRDGATPYLEPVDLFQYYPEACPVAAPAFAGDAGPRPLPETLGDEARALAEYLEPEPVPLDLLVERSGRPVNRLLAALCTLELHGVVEQLPGRRFRRI
jgi:DNA processing protein